MRGTVTWALGVAAIALGLAACGGSSSSSSSRRAASSPSSVGASSSASSASSASSSQAPSAPPSPASAAAKLKVITAVNRLAHESYRERLTVHTRYDTSGLPPAVAARYGAAPTAITASGAFESTRRVSIVESIPPRIVNLHIIVYDGATYLARDGIHYRRLTGPLAATLGNLSSLTPQRVFRSITDVRALGVTMVDGRRTEHYGAGLDPSGIRSLSAKIGGPLGLNPDAVGVAGAHVDVYLDPQRGQVVRLVTTSDTSVDLAKLTTSGASGLTGTLKLHQAATADVSTAGGKVRITRPRNAPALGA